MSAVARWRGANAASRSALLRRERAGGGRRCRRGYQEEGLRPMGAEIDRASYLSRS
ncbi:Os03g0386600 [Oryza sativa Japonica Group]|uniref:Os03g0386600 protein n=1 Tax=Oryza sativa subsp. japonica TaxID=39947 RepID=Q0DRG8_ORYSJ|nr:Os03g0386600 [Oryza sativa Japonica Group]|eukprot:NP_001050256.1 Os03g0386600 [Oryza sativa Japonica Group]